jgi:hypothetical protein
MEDKLLWTLQYWREYRTMEHLAHDYETVVSPIHGEIEWIENVLIQDGTFRLSGKKVLRTDPVHESAAPQVIAIDVTEHPIERPPKSRRISIPVKRNSTRLRHNSLSIW